mmetsp:Transcript_22153/g.62885  ORF Transcript_22153/g.62885 Transcript_22153/m.62885 type:complete len:482 (-) Transcript_22153:68-1513(-)
MLGTSHLRGRAPNTHGHQLFRCRGVDGDAGIKVALGGTHLHGNPESLQHLVRAHPDHVQSNHEFVGARRDELHDRLRLVLGLHGEDAVVQVGEFRTVRLDVVLSEFGDGFGFGHPARSDGGVGKDDGRHKIVRCPAVGLAAEDAIGKSASGRDRHRCQLDLAAHVSQGEDVVDGCVLEFVGLDVGGFIHQLDANLVQVQGFGVRQPTRGHEDDVDIADGTIVTFDEMDGLLAICRQVNCLDAHRIAVNRDALALHLGVQVVRNVIVEIAQRLGLADDQMRIGAQSVEDSSQFDGDVSRTDNDGLLRQFFQIEEPVARDGVLHAGRAAGQSRTATGGDQDLVGGELLLLAIVERNLDGVSIDEGGVAGDVGDVGILQSVAVDAVQLDDVLVTAFLQRLPVEVDGRLLEAVLRGIVLHHLCHAGRHEHDLLRDAADVDARSAEPRAFDHGDLLAVLLGGAFGCRQSAAASAEDDEVVVVSRCC